MENIVSEKTINRKRPFDDISQVHSGTDVVSVEENKVLDTTVEVDTTLQPSVVGALQTEKETTKSTEIASSVDKDRSVIDNRLQKRPNIENSSPAPKLPDDGSLCSHDQMIIMPSVVIMDDLHKVGNGDKLNDTQSKVTDQDTDSKVGNGDNPNGTQSTVMNVDTDSKVAEVSSFSVNNGEGGFDVISHPKLLGAPLTQLKKKLLVLDINGLLVDTVSPPPWGYRADTYIARRAIFKRPFCLDFLKFCFEKYAVGIWSSRTKINVEKVINYLFEDVKHKLLFCWDASHCTPSEFYTPDNNQKTLVFKELKKIWDKHDPDLPWEKGYYNETNTLLLDDSPYKALLNPLHTAIFPYSYTYRKKFDKSLGSGGDLRVYLECLAEAENVQDYVEQHPFGQSIITEDDPLWDFYVKAVGSAPPLSPPK